MFFQSIFSKSIALAQYPSLNHPTPNSSRILGKSVDGFFSCLAKMAFSISNSDKLFIAGQMIPLKNSVLSISFSIFPISITSFFSSIFRYPFFIGVPFWDINKFEARVLIMGLIFFNCFLIFTFFLLFL